MNWSEFIKNRSSSKIDFLIIDFLRPIFNQNVFKSIKIDFVMWKNCHHYPKISICKISTFSLGKSKMKPSFLKKMPKKLTVILKLTKDKNQCLSDGYWIFFVDLIKFFQHSPLEKFSFSQVGIISSNQKQNFRIVLSNLWVTESKIKSALIYFSFIFGN